MEAEKESISYYPDMEKKMGEQIERKAVELIERIRRRSRPRVSQEKIGEHLWPRRYDEEGHEVGDPQKSYSLLITPRKGKDPRRLKLGEFIDACEYLDFDPIQLLTLAKLAAEKGLEIDALLGDQPEQTQTSNPTPSQQQTITNKGKRLGHGSR